MFRYSRQQMINEAANGIDGFNTGPPPSVMLSPEEDGDAISPPPPLPTQTITPVKKRKHDWVQVQQSTTGDKVSTFYFTQHVS